jgi:hypothetical protein
LWTVGLVLVWSAANALAQPATAAGAKVWVGRHDAYEAFLETARTADRMERLPVGITRPMKVAFEPGGLIEFMVWKPIAPGIRETGYFESYKAEIAAYRVDRLLGLDMVPPTVERRIAGENGAAIMWVSGTRSFADLGKVPVPPGPLEERWNLQLIQAMMFDNLIGNQDPNLGNWLVDDGWNLILIDHSRSLTSKKDLFHAMVQFERDLWKRMQALDEGALAAALGRWLGRGEIRAILQRREAMAALLAKLVREKGEAAVLVGPLVR